MELNFKDRSWIWITHILFWILQMSLSAIIFNTFFGHLGRTLVIVLINLIGHMALVYGNFFLLLPAFFAKKKYAWYAILLFLLLMITASWRVWVGWGTVKLLQWPLEHFFEPKIITGIYLGGVWILLLSIPLRLIENSFKKEELETELKTQQLEAELRFLKAQVNPHFLFNALNNIYSLSFTNSEKTPEMILKLSEMMSYMLYDCKSEQVKLGAEVNYLNNFIDLQQLKKDGEQQIEFDYDRKGDHLLITPMLFIPFFENAFKHGNVDDVLKGWLKSKLRIKEDGQLNFHIANSIDPNRPKPPKGGIGLENIRERLQLLYPDKHQLEIHKTKDQYAVDLQIQLS